MDGGRQLLIRTCHAEVREIRTQHRGLQFVGKIGAFINHLAGAVSVGRNGRPAAEERMVVPGERLGRIELKEFGPVLRLIVSTGMVGIVFQRQGLRKIGELLVVEA